MEKWASGVEFSALCLGPGLTAAVILFGRRSTQGLWIVIGFLDEAVGGALGGDACARSANTHT